jgi:hypothetical protein
VRVQGSELWVSEVRGSPVLLRPESPLIAPICTSGSARAPTSDDWLYAAEPEAADQ